LPVSLARIGMTLMLVVDTMVVGRFGTDDLAALAIATVPGQTAQTIGVGFLMGGLIEIASAVGRGEFALAGAAWRRSLVYALAAGLLAMLFAVLALPWVLAPEMTGAVADKACVIVWIVGASAPGVLVFTAASMLLQALERPLVAVWITLAANVVNLGLDLVLVFGGFGLPALGGIGAAISTLVVRNAMALAIVVYVVRVMPGRAALGPARRSDHSWRRGRRQRRLGYAEALSMGIESGSFALMMVFAGRLGAREVAAYTIAINLNMLFFMVAVGIGGAAAVLVAQARGRGDGAGMAMAASNGFILFTAVTSVVAVAMLVFPEPVLGLYSRDPALAAVAVPIVAIIGLVNLVDGAQRVIANVLRAYGETWLPTTSHLVSYLAIMLPAGYLIGVEAGQGAYGLVLAIALASVVASCLLLARFLYLSRRSRPLLAEINAGELS
jgi:MATE family multidrug resistance protein